MRFHACIHLQMCYIQALFLIEAPMLVYIQARNMPTRSAMGNSSFLLYTWMHLISTTECAGSDYSFQWSKFKFQISSSSGFTFMRAFEKERKNHDNVHCFWQAVNFSSWDTIINTRERTLTKYTCQQSWVFVDLLHGSILLTFPLSNRFRIALNQLQEFLFNFFFQMDVLLPYFKEL